MTSFTEEELKRFDPTEVFEFKEPEPKLDLELSNCVMVANIPGNVPKEKLPKLQQVLQKILSMGNPERLVNLYIHTNSEGSSTGSCFVEYKSEKDAQECIKKLDNFEIDKKEKLNFKISSLSDFDKYLGEKSKNLEFPSKEYKEPIFLQEWLLDSLARDQYAIVYYDVVEILWNDPIERSISIFKKKNFTNEEISWSPFGTYLATFHDKGIVLWGGENFEKIVTLPFNGVKLINYSRKEKFLVTWNEEKNDNIAFWDIKFGKRKLVATIPVPKHAILQLWPIYKWSADDKYFGRIGINCLHIYETDHFEEKIIELESVQEFDWSPSYNMISYWIPEPSDGKKPAKIAVMEYPSKKEVRSKSFFKVFDISMGWNVMGDVVTFKLDIEQQKKNLFKHSLEIFFTKLKDCPVVTISYDTNIVNFFWEPKGNRLAVIVGDTTKNAIYFYQFTVSETNKIDIKEIGKLQEKAFDHVHWSPAGRYFVLTNSKVVHGYMEFWSCEPGAGGLDHYGNAEHFMMTDISWDPSGRYVATCVSSFKHQLENGYIIWSFLGRVFHKVKMEKFWLFSWRPRPPSLLTDAEEKKVMKDFQKKKQEIIKETKLYEDKQKQQMKLKKLEALDKWKELVAKLRKALITIPTSNTIAKSFDTGAAAVVSSADDDYVVVSEEIIESITDEQSEILVK